MKPSKAMKPSPMPKPSSSTGSEARQSTKDIKARAMRRRRDGRLMVARAAKLQAFGDLMGPVRMREGDVVHLLSRGHFDTVTIPAWFASEVAPIVRMTASSLSISADTVRVLKALEADGLLTEARVMVQDLTMSKSEYRAHIDAVRGWMHADNGHTLRIVETHAKVIVLEFDQAPPVVIEASANLTSNDNRLEQYVVTCDHGLAAFHLEWLDQAFGHGSEKLPRSWRPSAKPLTTIRGPR